MDNIPDYLWIGFARNALAFAQDYIKHIGKVVSNNLLRGCLILIAGYRQRMSCCFQGLQQFGNTLIWMGEIAIVLVVEGYEVFAQAKYCCLIAMLLG